MPIEVLIIAVVTFACCAACIAYCLAIVVYDLMLYSYRGMTWAYHNTQTIVYWLDWLGFMIGCGVISFFVVLLALEMHL